MTVVVAILGLAVGLLGTVLAVAAMSRARRMAALTASRIRAELAASGPLDPRAVRDVAVVRYDALEEMAGQLSFSVALLNAHGDGVVFTSINGRTETRTYAKVVADGRGVHQLSPEEEQAVRSAQLGHGPPTLLTQAPRLVGGRGPVRLSGSGDVPAGRGGVQGAANGPASEPEAKPASPAPGRRPEAAGPDQKAAAPGDAAKPETAAGAGTGPARADKPPAPGTPGPAAEKTGPAKTGPAKTGPVKTGAATTGPANTGSANTGTGKTAPAAGKPEPGGAERTTGPDGGGNGPAKQSVGRRLPKGA
jgi:Protein of unknown function (DUF4446)